MLNLLGDLKQFFKRPPVIADGTVYRMHVIFTTVVLFACSILITAKQYVGDPIQCIVEGLPVKAVNAYCWVTSTFTMPDAFLREQAVRSAHPGVGPGFPGEPRKYYTYYQWVCFVLFFQATMCYFPKWMWDWQEDGLMTKLVMGLHFRLGGKTKKEKLKKKLVNYMLNHTTNSHNSYATKYLMCEFLCLVNIIVQIYWMNLFFEGEFFKYGLRVIGMSTTSQEERIDPMVYIFPRVTKCTFQNFGPSGTIQTHDSLCVLPLNVVNEKMYIFIWFWYLVLLVALIFMFGYRLLILYNKTVRKNVLLYRHYMLITHDVAETVANKMSIGDWWILYMLGKNLDPLIYREVVREIATNTKY